MAIIPAAYWADIVPHLKLENVVMEVVVQEPALPVPSGKQE